jgi:hypothetical protein
MMIRGFDLASIQTAANVDRREILHVKPSTCTMWTSCKPLCTEEGELLLKLPAGSIVNTYSVREVSS